MCGRSWSRLCSIKQQANISGDITHARRLSRAFWVDSNCSGRLVLLWITKSRSCTRSSFTKSDTANLTRSQPHNLLSITTLNKVRSRRYPVKSSLTRIAQTCFGSKAVLTDDPPLVPGSVFRGCCRMLDSRHDLPSDPTSTLSRQHHAGIEIVSSLAMAAVKGRLNASALYAHSAAPGPLC